ncbi:MAG: hypothetical protein EXS13_00340 [Planctomycetes bacterium]|nr:hypothetical protein [Planctomycetota bacterium]
MPDESARGEWRLRAVVGAEQRFAGWPRGAQWPWPEGAAQIIGRNEGRAAWRLAEAPALVAKTFASRQHRAADREARLLEECARRGAAAPPLVARAMHEDGRQVLFLLAADGEPLAEALARVQGGRRRALLAALGVTIAALHRSGIVHRQLFAWHVLVAANAAAAPQVTLVDWAAARTGRAPARAARAMDWAALFATMSRDELTLAERGRLLRAAETDRGQRRVFAAAIRRAREGLLAKGRLPWPRAMVDRGDREGRVVVAAAVAERMAPGGAALAAESWLAPEGVVCVRVRDGRENLRWLAPPSEPTATWFGKRFEHTPWRRRAPAFQEWVNQRALGSLGIAVPEVVAVARREGGASVIWTRGVVPGTTLRELLPTVADRARRNALLARAGRIAARLHAAGFVHRDLYLDHLLLEHRDRLEQPGGVPDRLVLIDPSRVAFHVRLPERARTKDLAALEFSARAAGATRAERWRALLIYARGDRRAARRLAGLALAKAARIAAHERRHGRPAPRA